MIRSQNGGIQVSDVKGEMDLGTVNGGLDFDFPVTVRGRVNRRITTTLGEGGPPIRVTTTNGGVLDTPRFGPQFADEPCWARSGPDRTGTRHGPSTPRHSGGDAVPAPCRAHSPQGETRVRFGDPQRAPDR